ncbi:hypothetical protein [Phormidesmis priestleyi]|uniref:hypothetical protein n=1 Tax=Phormidesmis priestleyi TaxID=268141 RepID=UPI00083B6CEE|nr:hypothetical protein [Phormidesmis priestleyi]
MSKVIKQVSPQELQAWDLSPDSKISYYDGKLLIVSDADEEAPFGIAAKAGISALFGIAVFTHAPLVGVVCAAYAAYKVTETVRGLYGGDNALTSRLEQDLGIVAEPVPARAPDPVEATNSGTVIATSSPIGTATKLGAVKVPATVSKDSIACGQCVHFQKAAFEGDDGQCLAYRDHAKSDDPIAAKCKAFKVPASPAAQLPANKTELLDRLKVECSALLRLVKSQPIRAVGTQRTGKTTLVKKLALLRLLFLPSHKVIASTPHDEPENRYPSMFQVVGVKGGKRDYPAIARAWEAMSERIENGDRSSITTVWDEFGLFNKVMEEETLTSVLTSSLREATKHGEFPVFIVHGETQAFLPGSRGLVTVFLSSTVRVETIGELVTGADGLDEMRPTGKFRVQWLDGTKEEGQIPKWLSEEFLISLLPDSVVTNSQPETYPEKPAESLIQTDEPEDDAPEIGLNHPSVEEVKAQKKELFELGQAILELLQKNPDKSYGDEAIRTHRFIRETLGKAPAIGDIRQSINIISKTPFVRTVDEGRIQWNQPT